MFSRHGVTMAGGSTAFYMAYSNEQRKQPGKKIIPSLRLLSGGGAPMPPEIFYEVAREIGVVVAHGYGMTEIPMICMGSPSTPTTSWPTPWASPSSAPRSAS